MSNISKLIEELCPNGVEYRTLDEVSHSISAGGDMPSGCVKGQLEPSGICPYPVYSNGKTGNDLYGFAPTYKFEGPAVTISARGTIGFHAVRYGKFTPIVRLITVIPDESVVGAKFLNYILDLQIFSKTHGGIPQMTVPAIKKIRIALPPMEVQEEIVKILDRFTLLEAELEAELEARIKQYAFYRDSLLNFKNGDGFVTLDSLFDMKAGKYIPRSKIMVNSDGGYPCFGGNGVRGYCREYSHDGDYLIIGRQGALCGNVQRYKGKFYATEHAVVVTLKNAVDFSWAYHCLTQMNLRQYASKSAQPGLNVSTLKNLPIADISLKRQEHVGRILDRFDALVNDISSGLPAEITARRKQYEHYRDQLLTFKEVEPAGS